MSNIKKLQDYLALETEQDFIKVLKKFGSICELIIEMGDKENVKVESSQNFNLERTVLDRVKKLLDVLEYPRKDIYEEGLLKFNPSRKMYEVNGYPMPCGRLIEYYDADKNVYLLSTIEHNGHTYYLSALGPNSFIGNIHVRFPWIL